MREPLIYINIIAAIESGATTYSEIADRSKVSITNLGKYLKVLTERGILKRESPAIGNAMPVYIVAGNYVRFWSKFVLPNRENIEIGNFSLDDVRSQFNQYVSETFELIARESIPQLYRQKLVPFSGKVGRYWKDEVEIDVVCVAAERLMALEVKWKNLDSDEANKLIDQMKSILGTENAVYGVIARSIKDKEKVDGPAIELHDLFPGTTSKHRKQ